MIKTVIEVSDSGSNAHDIIANAAEALKNSEDLRNVFQAIYKGKSQKKTREQIKEFAEITNDVRLDNLLLALYRNKLADRSSEGRGKGYSYKKIAFIAQHNYKILNLATNKKALERFPTKTSPKIGNLQVLIKIPKTLVNIRRITIGEIDCFQKVKEQNMQKSAPVNESYLKEGIKRIAGESGDFKDWGGESDDLFIPVQFEGKRVYCAFALKGKGTSGKLFPGKMGKNGDQLQRLFRAPAEIFFVQYWGQIDESVFDLMESLACAKSAIEGKKIVYGLIDGQDTQRLISAYPDAFLLIQSS